jgi:hypothetical protein
MCFSTIKAVCDKPMANVLGDEELKAFPRDQE